MGVSPAVEAELLGRVRAGDRRALARLLSAVERGADGELAAALQAGGETPYTVGLTGAPGAGKSTLTDALIAAVRSRGERCAAFAVDPSSPFTSGAILGDRVRLRPEHAGDDGVFVRSFANRGRLGGLAAALPNAIRALALGGWPQVVIETVGVGQTEVDIAAWADTTIVVVTPGWGDEVQANKSGLMEIADLLVVNKADRKGVGLVEADLERMLDMSEPRDWRPPVIATVATEGRGADEVWDAVERHRRHLEESGELERRRRRRIAGELRQEVSAAISREVAAALRDGAGAELVAAALDGSLAPAQAARELLALGRAQERG